nr:30S ribosomal protein S8 [uncultured archaeon]
MTMNNPLASVLSKLQNAQRLGSSEITTKSNSKVIRAVLAIMQENGYIASFSETEDRKGNLLTLKLSGMLNKTGVVTPNFTVKAGNFEMFEKRYLPAKDFGVLIVTTSKGMMTHKQAKEQKLGGKIVAYAY